jgi:hypothetical protein
VCYLLFRLSAGMLPNDLPLSCSAVAAHGIILHFLSTPGAATSNGLLDSATRQSSDA